MNILPKALFILLFISLSVQNFSQNLYEKKIDSILSVMTLDEKIGQTALFSAGHDDSDAVIQDKFVNLIRNGKTGALLNACGSAYVHELQRIAVEENRLKIPLLFGFDVIHGYRTIFPIPIAQACTWDPELIMQSERIAAEEASAAGINWTYAPMVDITRDPRWGRVSEGAGEDTWLGCRIAEARVKGFQGDDLKDPAALLACPKHFAAYGAAMAGRDYNTVDMSPVSLYELYLPPFKAAIDAGAGSIMTSFNEINGMPSTANHQLLNDILRKEWKFKGFVVTDWTSINELVNHGVAGNLAEAASLAIHAGVDLDMEGNAYLNELKRLVSENKISLQLIDRCVRNILEIKFRLGLFDDPYRNCRENLEKKMIMTPDNISFARKMVSKSCVLLKNDNNTLPIPPGVKSIAIIGPLGDSKEDMQGCWSAACKKGECVSLADGIRNRVGNTVKVLFVKGCNANDQEKDGFDAAIDAAASSDFVILALGEEEWMTGEASSRSKIGLPGVQEELAEKIIRLGKHTAVVLFNGRPLVLTNISRIAPAILEVWFGGTESGNGVADLLFGDVNPSGKLTMTFPRDEGQIPVFYNSKSTGRPYDPKNPGEKYVSRYIDVPNDPLFPFGFGLSYTHFLYSGLAVTTEGNTVTANVMVTNTGERDGEEVVQLYIRDKVATITRPVKELKGFKKLMIRKGETAEVKFMLTADDLAFWHPDLTKRMEPGEFILYVGTNSAETVSQSFWMK